MKREENLKKTLLLPIPVNLNWAKIGGRRISKKFFDLEQLNV